MPKTVHAIYENGVFKPTEALDLPDQCQVEFEIRIVAENTDTNQALNEVYAVLSESFDGGQFDDAARHNEHQP
ncbi:MAG: antitoxin family protein [Pirellulaceae bacterium]|nr:antitoxin family protein [Pirellulaceae bacterium]